MREYPLMIKMRRFKIDKLIRDRFPEILSNSGIKVFERNLSQDEYIDSLKDKLVEEAQEICDADNKDDILEELADLFEVMTTFAKVQGFELQDIMRIAEEKKLNKGGFVFKTYVDFVEIESTHPNIKYYQASPAKYPEII